MAPVDEVLTTEDLAPDLQKVAKVVRRDIITMLARTGSGHPGGSLSCVEILVALYWRVLRHDPKNPSWPDRDRFILSKGHAVPVLYAVLAKQGYFPVEELGTLRRLGSRLHGHAVKGSPPGVEMTAGSLGQGLSFSLGLALAARMDGRSYQVYCLLGDGELNEGQVWEAAMACAHYQADNVTAIVDRNRIQNDGFGDYDRYPGQPRSVPGGWVDAQQGHTVNIMSLEPLAEKWRAFGWHVIEVDGHDLGQLVAALEEAKATNGTRPARARAPTQWDGPSLGRPTVIIAHTVKGKGVSFMENNPAFHGKAPTPEQAEQALRELA